MAKFGAKKKAKKSRKKGGGSKDNRWRAYVNGGGSYTPGTAPIPD